jgi:hypothetical protein
VLEQRFPTVRVAAGHFQVLGRDAVADLAGLFHAARKDQRPASGETLGDDLGTRHGGQQAVDFALQFQAQVEDEPIREQEPPENDRPVAAPAEDGSNVVTVDFGRKK